MQGLMLHCGGEKATYEDLGKVELPEKTHSYVPVGHQYVVDQALKKFQPRLNLEVKKMAFGLAQDGKQMFGVIAFHAEGATWGPSIGLRNSYNKTLSVGVAMGANVFVCDNLCFSGEAFTVLRKHTTNVLDDLNRLFYEASEKAIEQYSALNRDLESFRQIPMDMEMGFANLGILYGRKAITSSVFNEAARYWEEPPHVEHKERNVFNWYQAVNHGLKKAPPARALESYSKLHTRAEELRVIDV